MNKENQEATTRGAFVRGISKKLFLKISQNLQENNCVGVSFLQALG